MWKSLSASNVCTNSELCLDNLTHKCISTFTRSIYLMSSVHNYITMVTVPVYIHSVSCWFCTLYWHTNATALTSKHSYVTYLLCLNLKYFFAMSLQLFKHKLRDTINGLHECIAFIFELNSTHISCELIQHHSNSLTILNFNKCTSNQHVWIVLRHARNNKMKITTKNIRISNNSLK